MFCSILFPEMCCDMCFRVGKGNAALATANAALESITKALANDFGPRVRVNCVSPGLTNTEMWSSMPAAQREGCLLPNSNSGTLFLY